MSDLDEWMNEVHTGDALNLLTELPSESVHAVITDPPYGLAFMGRDWDDFQPKEYQEWTQEWAEKARRVLRPGGHLLAFSGNRTHHRLFTGIEDADMEIRDTLTWHYGSGFPKALDVSKAIDKQAYKQRHDIQAFGNYLKQQREAQGLSKAEIDRRIGTNTAYSWWEGRKDGIQLPDWEHYQQLKDILDLDNRFDELMEKESADREVVSVDEKGDRNDEVGFLKGLAGKYERTRPKRDVSEKWNGWKTALKPSTEFIVLARKPLSENTVAENIQTYGTGALNIDACRIDTADSDRINKGGSYSVREQNNESGLYGNGNKETWSPDKGRYPANTILDQNTAQQLDHEVGDLSAGHHTGEDTDGYGEQRDYDGPGNYTSTGGPSRYYYTSKATRAERTLNARIKNPHPTVKPLDLMEWLTKLTTKQNQIILDPFAGTGTTLRAAKNHGRQFIGIEKQPKWADIARARTGLTPNDPNRFTEEQQTTLRQLATADGGDA